MALLQIAQQENLLPTDEEIDKQLAERAEKTKKTVEEIKAGTDIAALRKAKRIPNRQRLLTLYLFLDGGVVDDPIGSLADALVAAQSSGIIIFNRAMPGGLRIARHSIFTGKSIKENCIPFCEK